MRCQNPLVALLLAGLLSALPFSTCAFADNNHDRTQVGHNISIGPDEEVSEATCFGCSIRVRGHVAGDVTTFGGSLLIEEQGEVDGDATTFGGDMRLDKAVRVGGDVTVFGGRIRRDPEAAIGGDVTNLSTPGWIVVIFVLPLVVLGAFIALAIWLIRRMLRPTMPVAA